MKNIAGENEQSILLDDNQNQKCLDIMITISTSGIVHYSTVLYSIAHYTTVQYSTVNTVQYIQQYLWDVGGDRIIESPLLNVFRHKVALGLDDMQGEALFRVAKVLFRECTTTFCAGEGRGRGEGGGRG